jgi:hypothetical protein
MDNQPIDGFGCRNRCKQQGYALKGFAMIGFLRQGFPALTDSGTSLKQGRIQRVHAPPNRHTDHFPVPVSGTEAHLQENRPPLFAGKTILQNPARSPQKKASQKWALPTLLMVGSALLSACSGPAKRDPLMSPLENKPAVISGKAPESNETPALQTPEPRQAINDGKPLTPHQFSWGMALDYPREVRAMCGPLTLYGFLKGIGRPISIDEALTVAKQVGWSSKDGMGGARGMDGIKRTSGRDAFLDMFKAYGIPLVVGSPPDWSAVTESLDRGVPVVIHIVGEHYALAQDYRYTANHQLQLDMGHTFTVFRSAREKRDPAEGQRWFLIRELQREGQVAVLYLKPEVVAQTGVKFVPNPAS